MSRKTRTVLSDRPTDSDYFSGGGHSRTARTLANVISNSDKSDSVIGIVGTWGAGKTSVMEMARPFLKENTPATEYHIFSYDLWTNQSVPFRRGFLENLVE
jgi:chromosomal replication initiation ATPase DnaA